MTLNQKLLNFNCFGSILLNFSIYLFISSLIYYLLSLNITLLKLCLLFSFFVLVFYLSSKKMEFLLQKMELKNIMVISKFLLGIIKMTAAVLIYNNFILNSVYLYLLILITASLHAVLNRSYDFHYQNIIADNKTSRTKELIFHFNLEKLLIIILSAFTAIFIEINLIPFILIAIAVYYFLSGYINTFQEI